MIPTDYLRVGLCVLPANREEKRPALTRWKQYQKRLPTQKQVNSWFAIETSICVLTGAVSLNLEMMDFDNEGELFDRWRELVLAAAPELFGRLVVESSQSGGRHVVYRCEVPVPGNRKLAQRMVETPDIEPVVIGGKRFVPRKVGDRFQVTLTLIETRGEGGLFLCAPTTGYILEQGTFENLPVLTADEQAVLIEAARSLTEIVPPVETMNFGAANGRPGDDFNSRGDVRQLLRRHGWTLFLPGENEHWCRPGKQRGCSATLKDNVFYVFSSNAAPFEPDKGYAPFSLYTLLEHDGDFAKAASTLRTEGYGGDDSDVDLSGLVINGHSEPAPPSSSDPGPLPDEMFRIPGFVSEVMDHCLETAPYPNVPLAFCGALALQALLAGRKVRDDGDVRTNVYLLALAYSAVGKDWPRKVNANILHRIGLIDSLGERFASGEGIQDALFRNPSLLFQTDEIDGILQSINKSPDARHENILGTLLTMYSVSNSVFPMRRKASKEPPGVIDQPCLVVFGTAIPTHYYSALSERMLTNGFFARMLIVESGKRTRGQRPKIVDTPARVLETAKWWSDYAPGIRNLERFHPVPKVVEADVDAGVLLDESRVASEDEYGQAESRGDAVGTTVWGRVPEQVRKLALLYAVSADQLAPQIGVAAVRWASRFVEHQTRRMLFMASSHVADTPFHADCLKLLRKLREAPNRQMQRQHLLRYMHCKAADFEQLVGTLVQRGEIMSVSIASKTKPSLGYQAL